MEGRVNRIMTVNKKTVFPRNENRETPYAARSEKGIVINTVDNETIKLLNRYLGKWLSKRTFLYASIE